jgi:hypothetical protein
MKDFIDYIKGIEKKYNIPKTVTHEAVSTSKYAYPTLQLDTFFKTLEAYGFVISENDKTRAYP